MRCTLCPRMCGAERTETRGEGFCRMPAGPVVARAGLHMWEEPVISGTRGSGTVFFSGCTLGCVFCQNGRISRENFGKTVTVSGLITGQDLVAQLKGEKADEILITESMLRQGEDIFLDDMTLEQAQQQLGIRITLSLIHI